MYDMDTYREAFDIHGETVTCCSCGCEMDSLTVEHYDHNAPSGENHLCDRCYWERDYQQKRDDPYYDEDHDFDYWGD